MKVLLENRKSPIHGNDCELRIEGTVAEIRPIVCCIYSMYYDSITREQRARIGDDYWRLAGNERFNSNDLRGVYHILMMALLGGDVLVGADRLCRPLVEGEPLGLPCSLMQANILINRLYNVLYARGYIKDEDTENLPVAWEVEGNNDFPTGIRVARAICKLGGKSERVTMLALKVLAIAKCIDRVRVDAPDRMVA